MFKKKQREEQQRQLNDYTRPDEYEILKKKTVKELIAPLVAEYATSHEAPTFPHTEEMLIILPEWLCKK